MPYNPAGQGARTLNFEESLKCAHIAHANRKGAKGKGNGKGKGDPPDPPGGGSDRVPAQTQPQSESSSTAYQNGGISTASLGGGKGTAKGLFQPGQQQPPPQTNVSNFANCSTHFAYQHNLPLFSFLKQTKVPTAMCFPIPFERFHDARVASLFLDPINGIPMPHCIATMEKNGQDAIANGGPKGRCAIRATCVLPVPASVLLRELWPEVLFPFAVERPDCIDILQSQQWEHPDGWGAVKMGHEWIVRVRWDLPAYFCGRAGRITGLDLHPTFIMRRRADGIVLVLPMDTDTGDVNVNPGCYSFAMKVTALGDNQCHVWSYTNAPGVGHFATIQEANGEHQWKKKKIYEKVFAQIAKRRSARIAARRFHILGQPGHNNSGEKQLLFVIPEDDIMEYLADQFVELFASERFTDKIATFIVSFAWQFSGNSLEEDDVSAHHLEFLSIWRFFRNELAASTNHIKNECFSHQAMLDFRAHLIMKFIDNIEKPSNSAAAWKTPELQSLQLRLWEVLFEESIESFHLVMMMRRHITMRARQSDVSANPHVPDTVKVLRIFIKQFCDFG